MINVIHRMVRKPAMPRTGRTLDAIKTVRHTIYAAGVQSFSGMMTGIAEAEGKAEQNTANILSLAARVQALENIINGGQNET
jgi:hypothetical protein